MSDPKQGIALGALAALSQMNVEALEKLIAARPPWAGGFTIGEFILDRPGPGADFPALAALTIEVARQMADDGGLPLIEALRIVSYTGAIEHYRDYLSNYGPTVEMTVDSDFWAAVIGARNNWGHEPRLNSSIEVTGFGPGEFWSMAHYHGPFLQVMTQIRGRIGRDADDYPDSDYARLFMVNVSVAARRLGKRAAELGIDLSK
jgi:hypothetical protein